MIVHLELESPGTKFPFDKDYNENLKKFAATILSIYNKPGWALIYHKTIVFGMDSPLNTNGGIAFGVYISIYHQRVFKTEIVGKLKVDERTIVNDPLSTYGGQIKVIAELLYEEYSSNKVEDLFGQVPIIPFDKFPEEFRNGFLVTHTVR